MNHTQSAGWGRGWRGGDTDRSPRHTAAHEARVLHPGPGRPVSQSELDQGIERFVGQSAMHGWIVVHRMPGSAVLSRTTAANTASAVGVGFLVAGPMGAAAGAAGSAAHVERAQIWGDLADGAIYSRTIWGTR
ncbi:hypothetical protein ACN20G_02555 [Streptomyces sp. BI20]|uniref:hypothetical protein n=1 Tax=Streptomyces sp. BI20 TaxID=3403460 RepID=UPI003C7698E5